MKKDWIEVELGEVLKTTSGGTPSRGRPEYYSGSIPWVKSGELNQNTILDTEEKISEDAVKNSSAKLFPKGTLLIALYGATIGKLAFLGIEAATNQAVCGIFENEAINSKFLYYFLFHNRRKLVEQGAGGAQPNISQTILKNLPIVIAPLPEQRAIVSRIEELFSDLDHAISNLQSAQAKLEIYRQSVLKKAFEGGQDFKLFTINDSCTNIVDCLHSTAKFESSGYYCIDTTCIDDSRILYEKVRYVDKSTFLDRIRRLKPEAGDILFSREGTVGKTVIVPPNVELCLGQRMMMFRLLDEISSKYFMYYLQSPEFKKQYKPLIGGTTAPHLNIRDIKRLTIPIYNSSRQEKIVQEIESRLSVADKLAETIETNLKKSESLRQSILKKAFEGKLLSEAELEACRKEADWEPAEKLLERIKGDRKTNDLYLTE